MSFAFIVQGVGVSVLVILGLFGHGLHVAIYARKVEFNLKKINLFSIPFPGTENVV